MKKYLFIVLLVGVCFGQIYYPDSTKILFDENIEVQQDGGWATKRVLRIANYDGTGVRTLSMDTISHTSVMNGARNINVSPSGDEVLFVATNGQNQENRLYYIDINSDELRQLADSCSSCEPYFSPNENHIFYRAPDDPRGALIKIDYEGTIIDTLLFGDIDWSFRGSFSPDGSQLLYSVELPSNQYREIFIMNEDGTDQQRLTNNDAAEDFFIFSNDGTMMYYTKWEGTGHQKELRRINIDGTNDSLITKDFSRQVFSNDRDLLAFKRGDNVWLKNLETNDSLIILTEQGSPNSFNYPIFALDEFQVPILIFGDVLDWSGMLYKINLSTFELSELIEYSGSLFTQISHQDDYCLGDIDNNGTYFDFAQLLSMILNEKPYTIVADMDFNREINIFDFYLNHELHIENHSCD